MKTLIKVLATLAIIIFMNTNSSAYPGRGEDHSQEYDQEQDQGNAPGDPGGGGGPVGPIDGGVSIILVGGIAYYLFRKRKNMIK